jgi:SpoIID/LytB domain protein
MRSRRVILRFLPLGLAALLLGSVMVWQDGVERRFGEDVNAAPEVVVSEHDVPVVAAGAQEKTDAKPAPKAAPATGTRTVAELAPTTVKPFSMVGVTWRSGVPNDAKVQVRWRHADQWTGWSGLELDTANTWTEGGRPGTESTWVGHADGVAVRVRASEPSVPRDLQVATIDPGKDSGTTPVAATIGQPPIIMRGSWGADNSGTCDSPVYGATTLGAVIHHTAGSNSYSKSDSASIVRATQAYHMHSRNWCDIGYNFLIDKYGQIFEGRKGGIDKPVRAAHSGNGAVNEETMGVSLMGTYSSVEPSSAMKAATADLVAWRFSRYKIPAKGTYSLGGKTLNRIAGHRNVISTECPGAKAYAWLSASGGLRDRVATLLSTGTDTTTTHDVPTGLSSTAKTSTSLTFGWKGVSGAPRYRIQLSTSSSMSGATYYRFYGTSGTITGLKAGTNYYAKIRTIEDDGTNLSAYSSAVSATTSSTSTSTAVPKNLKSTDQTSTSLTFAWDAVTGAPRYRIQLSTSSSMSNATYYRFYGTSGTVSGLKAGTKYYAKIRTIKDDGTNISAYSSAISATTDSSSSSSTSSSTSSSSSVSTSSKVVSVPASKSFSLKGHGYGHGIGMSQYGAEGAARSGKSYSTILDHYYPGTDLGSKSGTIRVLVSADSTDSVMIEGRSGLKLKYLSSGKTLSLPDTISGQKVARWSIDPLSSDKKKSTLRYRTGSTWKTYKSTTWTGDAQFEASTMDLVMPGAAADRTYRTALRSALPKSGATTRDTVNALSIDNYTRGVVPREVPSTWHAEALKAQAVAARTYGARAITSSRDYDICDTTACQVYGGADAEKSSTDDAVSATAGKILTYGGKAAFTQFSSSSGGWSAEGSQPYLKAVSDGWDDWSGNANHDWTKSVSASTIQSKYSSIGTLKSMKVTKRNGHGDWGGRVVSLELVGSKATKTISGNTARTAFGLRSNWFTF